MRRSKLGDHLFIGEIRDVEVDQRALAPDGALSIEAARPLIYSPGSRDYFGVGERGRVP